MDTNMQLFIFMRPFFFDLYMSFNQKIYLLLFIYLLTSLFHSPLFISASTTFLWIQFAGLYLTLYLNTNFLGLSPN